MEHHWRDDGGYWWQATWAAGDTIDIPCLGMRLPVDAIHEDIALPATPIDDVEI